jgi:hypothetical protein
MFLAHSGNTLGQRASLLICPEESFALAVLTNHDNGGAVAGAIQSSVLGALLGIHPSEPRYIDFTPQELSEYVGKYTSQLLDARVTLQGDGLHLQVTPKGGFPDPDTPPLPAPPPTRLAFEAKDSLVALDPPLAGDKSDFLRGPDSQIAWFRSAGRLHRRGSE